ncbi:growth-regulating factor 3-like isoform X2 [Telopea speciosissima]|uniref:growth-regulating factor 3-like isoform X2 n=1 Tax=Telopea speciosissima TaxID=54955 RepID=UPI001CC3C5F2|nr:growth-regulating factor 3-like isoform X2 [Telopea speciosissima]
MDFHDLKQWEPQNESDHSPSAKTPKLFEPHQEPSEFALPLFIADPNNSRISNLSVFSDSSSTSTRFPRMGSFFSLDQWRELELQALIFKYMLAGVAVPPELLDLINKSLLSLLQLGYWGRSMVDPEPGRCRRTDGKKWRCSRDVATGHKYCERHMHRGRNRSRKPVEIPTHNAPGGGGLSLTPMADSSLTTVASGNHFDLSVPSPSIDLFHLNQRSSECKAGNGELGLESFGASGGEGRQVGRGVLRHFFDDWPRLHNHHHQHQEQQPCAGPSATISTTSLSIAISGNEIAPSSDFSLKLSTGNGDEVGSEIGVAGESLQRRQQIVNSNNNWSMGWRGYPVASMGGPLAEALRSSTSNTSPTSVLHELPRGSVSEASSVST